MYNKRWIFKKNTDVPEGEKLEEYLMNKYSLPLCAAKICIQRGVYTKEDADRYFSESAEMLSDPYSMKGMDEAVERITEAADNGEIITIYGDYDADGVTATSILYTFLSQQTEGPVYFKIPDRFTEGYGMSEKALKEIAEYGTKLIITVDNGIKSTEEIEYAKELGMDVVVTDHHTRGEKLPLCSAIVNPIFEDERSPLKNLSGAGVAFKLCEALGSVFGSDDEELYPLLAMAAVGTLGDAVSLTGENRLIVRCGLKYIRQGCNMGLEALALEDGEENVRNLTAGDVSFRLVPRINAAGRMGDPSRAIDLLTATDTSFARRMARELTEENNKRKQVETEITLQAFEEEHIFTKQEDSVFLSLGEGWHHGVIGLVAARCCERTGKPSFIFSAEESDPQLLRGSARSVEGFDLREALAFCEDLTEKYGGHEMAAGLTVRAENIRAFINRLNEFAAKNGRKKGILRTLKADLMLSANNITPDNFEGIKKLEPFGTDNEEPLICTVGLEVCDIRLLKEGIHARITFKAMNPSGTPFYFSAVKFDCKGYPLPNIGECCSIIYKAAVNRWQGRITAEPLIEDIFDGCFCIDNSVKKLYNEDYISDRGFYLDRDTMTVLFKGLRASGGACGVSGINNLKTFIEKAGFFLTRYQIVYGLYVFRELGFVSFEKNVFRLIPEAEGRKLEDSEIFRELS